jgi:putative transposase
MDSGPSIAIPLGMARRPRLQFPGAVYHVMSRGNRKSDIFNTNDDRRCFMNTLGESALTYHVRVYAACLMRTHYHIVLDTPRGNLSAMMRQLNGEYSQDCNRRYERTGHTFEARFHSIVVQRERYLRRVARYVVLNPVKGRLCADPAAWPWTTYRATAGLEPCQPWLHIDWIDWAFKTDSRSEAHERYRKYVNNGVATPLHIDTGVFILGTKRFHQAVLTAIQESEEDRLLPQSCRAWVRTPLDSIFADVEANYRSRDEAILAAHHMYGHRLAEIAVFLGIHSSTASKALRRACEARAKATLE